MTVANIPEAYIEDNFKSQEIFVYDLKMTNEVVKNKVNLGMHMFSFLQVGRKQVHCADTSIAVNKNQSLLLKKGNWLWTELLETEGVYFCKLLFFSDKKLIDFLNKHVAQKTGSSKEPLPYYTIENDSYINTYLNSLSFVKTASEELLSVKFEELLLYLIAKYGPSFERYLHSLIIEEPSAFKKTIDSTVDSNLKLEEIAFLCHMSISTFKRHFVKEYGISPGKWLQDKRLQKAKELLLSKEVTPSDIYQDFGYNNLSNFSAAFKNKFGYSPSKIKP